MQDILNEFVRRLPRHPFATDDPELGLVRPRSKREALTKRHVQLHPERQRGMIALDIDRDNAVLDWQERFLPPPNFTVQKIDLALHQPTHSFAYYLLDDPVHFQESGTAPKKFYDGVVMGLTAAWDADWGYHGFLGWNPLAKTCPIYRVHYFTTRLYRLADLARHVDTNAKMPKPDPVWMETDAEAIDQAIANSGSQGDFEFGRQWAYRHVSWYRLHSGFSEFRIALAEQVLKVSLRPNRKLQRLVHRIAQWTWDNHRAGYRRPCQHPGILGLKGTGIDQTTACRLGQTYTADLRRNRTVESILAVLQTLPKGTSGRDAKLAIRHAGIPEDTVKRYSRLISDVLGKA